MSSRLVTHNNIYDCGQSFFILSLTGPTFRIIQQGTNYLDLVDMYEKHKFTGKGKVVKLHVTSLPNAYIYCILYTQLSINSEVSS